MFYFQEMYTCTFAIFYVQLFSTFSHFLRSVILHSVVFIGGHLLLYPWSAISDWAWYQSFRYRTEKSGSDIIPDIGINFYPISYNRPPKMSYLFIKMFHYTSIAPAAVVHLAPRLLSAGEARVQIHGQLKLARASTHRTKFRRKFFILYAISPS